MRQERKELLRDCEKFEGGVLRADACMERYLLPRDCQYRTKLEDFVSGAFGSSAVWEERSLMRDVHRLIAEGHRLLPFEALEDFVARHSDILQEEGV